MLPLPVPKAGGKINELGHLLGLLGSPEGNRAFKLLVGWMLMTLSPTGPYPILVVGGEPGGGKSTLGSRLNQTHQMTAMAIAMAAA